MRVTDRKFLIGLVLALVWYIPETLAQERTVEFKQELRTQVTESFYSHFEYPVFDDSEFGIQTRKTRKVLNSVVNYEYGATSREGRVTVVFSVYRGGTITRPAVVKGLCPEIDKAVRQAMKQVGRDVHLHPRYNDAEYLMTFYISPDVSKQTKVKSDEKIYIKPEYPAIPQGGDEGLMEYVRHHIRYPQRAMEESRTGTVETIFIVDEEGYVEAGCVYCGGSADFDRAALRLVAGIPPMEPATENGQAVKSYWTWPVVFNIR